MPTRSQRHLVAVGREASNGQGVDYDPGVITSFTAVGGLGNAKFSVTPGAGCDRVNVYRVPAGGTLDKAVHPMIPSFCTPNLPMTFYDGDPDVVNIAAGTAQVGRQWMPGAVAPGFTDNFNRANANLEASAVSSGGGSWSHDGRFAGAGVIDTNVLRSNVGDNFGSAYKTPDVGSLDHYCQYKVADITSSPAPFVCCRLIDVWNYIGIRNGPTSTEVYARVAGTFIAQYLGAASAIGDIIRLACVGSTWVVSRNGAILASGTIPPELLARGGTGVVMRSLLTNKFEDVEFGKVDKYTHGATNLENRVMTSLDGINWAGGTVPTDASPQQWSAVCWAPELNLFCAVATSGGTPTTMRAMTSPDGINWTIRTSVALSFRGMCWGGPAGAKLFVAVSSGALTNNIATSPDGITWTARTKANTTPLYGVCWSQELGLFCAVANSGALGKRAWTSPDGINWTERDTPVDNAWTYVCWSPELSLFVAVANAGSGTLDRVMTSPNGINWTIRTTPAGDHAWQAVTWGGPAGAKLFVAVAWSGSPTTNRIMTSPDGINWTTRTNPSGNALNSVLWVPELAKFITVAFSGATTVPRVQTSPDGINWTARLNAPTTPTWQSVAWSPTLGRLVAVALANGITYEKLWWSGAGAKAGETWRFAATVSDGTTLGTSNAIQTTFGNPDWEPATLTNSFGNATRRRIWSPTQDEDWVGFSVSTDAAVALSALAIFKENYKCAPQGTWDYYPFPATRSGVEGPGLPVVAGVVII